MNILFLLSVQKAAFLWARFHLHTAFTLFWDLQAQHRLFLNIHPGNATRLVSGQFI